MPKAKQRLALSLATLLCFATLACTISSSPGTKTPVTLAIAPSNPTLKLGLSQAFLAVAQLHDGTLQDATAQTQWTSSNTAVATIDRGGLLKTVSQGNTTVTAVFGALKASTQVTVTPPGVIAVDITPASPGPIQVGDTISFTATGTMSDGSPPPDITNKVTWVSGNSAVANVTSAGVAKGLAVGVTLISATYGSGQNAPAGFVTVIVNPVLNSLTVFPATASIAKSTSQQFTAIGLYSDGSTQDLSNQISTQWACAPSGIVTSISKGLAKVGATAGTCNVTATATLSNGTKIVNSPAPALTVGAQVITQLVVTPAVPSAPIAVPVQFHATGQFSDGSVQDVTAAPGITWNSSNLAVAAKPVVGKTTTVGAGASTISAKFGGTTVSSNLTVASATISSITVTSPLTKLGEGTTVQLKATGKFSDGSSQDLTNAATWKSSGSAIAVSASGLATGNFPGSATITASLNGATGKSPTLQVNAETIKSVLISPASATIAPGTVQPFKATVTFLDKTQQDITPLVQWSSSDASVATVAAFGSNPGLAAGLTAGTSNISAVFGSVSGSTSALTVTGASPSTLAITVANPSPSLGTSQQLKATVTFSDGSTQDVTPVVTWASDNILAVVVNSSGLAVTSGSGSAIITATFTSSSGTASNSATITVP
jgi:trimeric autotransporter adhesin